MISKPLTLKQNMLWNSAGSLCYLGFQWLITILIVRLSLGYEAAGTFSLAMSVYNMFAPLAIYRMYTYQVSDVKGENSTGEYFAFRMITCGIALVCCFVYAGLTCSPQTIPTILLYALFKIASLLIDVLHGTDQMNMRMDYIGKSLMLQGILTFIAFCIIFYLTQSLEITLFGMLIVTVCIGFFFDLPRTKRFELFHVGISRSKAVHLLSYCFPIVLAAIACAAAPSIPRQYLSASQGESMLGIYASVAAPVAIIQMGASYIYNPLLSIFSQYYTERNNRKVLVLFVQVAFGIALIGIVCAVLFEIFGSLLLGFIFGQSILNYTYLLLPIITTTIVSAYVWFLNDLLVAIRNFKGSFTGNIIALVIAIPSSLMLVNHFGMNGISFTGIISYGVGALVMVLFLFTGINKSQHKD